MLSLKEILGELATSTGRHHLLDSIDNLDGDIAAKPEPPKPGEAEEIEAQMEILRKRQAELRADAPAEDTETLTEGGN